MSERLAGKVALVTGGARGIGRAISERFAAEGASVVMAGRNAEAGAEVEDRIKRAGGRALFVQTDVTDRTQVAHAVEATISEFGSLTTLVNNAAHGGEASEGGLTFDKSEAPAMCSPAEWDLMISTDLTSVYNVCHFAIPHMIKAGGGSIMALGSTTATYGQAGSPGRVAAKAGVSGLMRSIAVDYGEYLIRANTIVPGMVPHDQYALIGEGEIGDRFRAAGALPFLGEPEDVAGAALYLASDDARWVTATELEVTGGITRAPDVLDLVQKLFANGAPGAPKRKDS